MCDSTSLIQRKKTREKMNTGEMMAVISSSLTSFMFLYMMFQKHFPYRLAAYFERYTHRIIGYFNPYMQITIYELSGDRLKTSDIYTKIQAYLSSTESSKQVKRLKADTGKDSKKIAITMDDNGEIPDEYQGVKLWWYTRKSTRTTKSISFYPTPEEKRYLTLKFHKRYRDLVANSYLNYAMEEGKSIGLQNRQRKLFTNNPSKEWYGWKRSVWSHVVFDHPANFDTLAMDPVKKKEIIDDLITFSKGKEYYKKIGKAWKRGYLLYGPPGTGKSTMIAAMANFLNYDIYDLELTAVKENSELRKLLIETSNKSMIVIEDIDCSLELTGQRKKEKENDDDDDEEKDPIKKTKKQKEDVKESKVTLSGLLNFIDGLWSACGGERLIVFTTNYVEKLDPALIRRGRMDKHIELSYCGFEGFKVLAKNYLDIESHDLFETIRGLLEETQMTPADVAENLMPKTVGKDAETNCLVSLIQALESAKEEAKLKKAEEEAAAELEKKKKAKEEAAASKDETKLKESTQIEKEEAKQEDSTQLVKEKETTNE